MDEKQVEVIKKVDGPVIRDRRKMGKPLTIQIKVNRRNIRIIMCEYYLLSRHHLWCQDNTLDDYNSISCDFFLARVG